MGFSVNVSICIHLCIHIYICIYIQVHKKSRHGTIYTYISIYTHKRTVAQRVRCMSVCIYIYVWTSSKNFCKGRSTLKKCRSGYSRYGQLPLWPVVPLWLPSWRIVFHRSVTMIGVRGAASSRQHVHLQSF